MFHVVNMLDTSIHQKEYTSASYICWNMLYYTSRDPNQNAALFLHTINASQNIKNVKVNLR